MCRGFRCFGVFGAAGLTNAWGSRDTIDRKRLEAEKQAFENLLLESAKTWKGIADRAR
jgi:hypothetical protein